MSFLRRATGRGRVDPAVADRVPPGQYVTEQFPVLTVGRPPKFDPTTWDLRVTGLVDTPQRFDWETFRALPTTTVTTDIHCVTRWSKLGTTWTGVSLRHLESLAGVRAEARYVIFHCDGGYSANVPIAAARADEAMLTYEYEGEPLTREHGFPVRSFIPSLYFWKSAKFLRIVEYVADDRPGFWEQNGYHNDADPWLEQRHWGD